MVCIAMLLASCNSILSSKPSGTLSEKEMVDILVDIHLTEATLKMANDSGIRLSDTNELRKRYAQVFVKNDVDPDDFNASLNYYLEHIDEFEKIYVEVINRLTALEVTLQPKTNIENEVLNKRNLSQLPYAINNPWFRSLNRNNGPEEIHYFDRIIYPVSKEVKYRYPIPY